MRALTWDDFAEAEGTVYEVSVGGEQFELALERAQQLGAGPTGRSFRLEFVGPVDPVLPQAIYPFRTGDDAFEIFIVPIDRKPSGTRYEAIFG
jgi:hypothetical protein